MFSSILTDGDYEEDPSGIGSLRILSDGSITPSTYLISSNFRRYNIREENVFAKIEEDNNFGLIEGIIPEKCKQCSFVSSCKGGVFDRRYLWYTSFNERDPYCPYREENYIQRIKIKVDSETAFTSVHHGYLPTMFFTNR